MQNINKNSLSRVLRSSLAILFLGMFLITAAYALPNDITRVSVSSSEAQSNATSDSPVLSNSGRFVAFTSTASNLVNNDDNGKTDIFLRDRTSGTTSLVSKRTSSVQANDHSSSPAISADGNFIAYSSLATNIVNNDSNSKSDIFLYDVVGASTTRITLDTTSGSSDGDSITPSITSTGRYIAFASTATDLVTGDTNAKQDIFVFDRNNDSTILISRRNNNTPANGDSSTPIISQDGGFVVFVSDASNLVVNDTNNKKDIFLYNASTSTITRVNTTLTDSQGLVQANDVSSSPSLSSNGRFIVYESLASNLISSDANSKSDIFFYDRLAETTIRITHGATSDTTPSNGNSHTPVISADGLNVAFVSDATNLISGDSNNSPGDGKFDFFLYSVLSDSSERKNLTLNGNQTHSVVASPAISEFGSVLAFVSPSTGLIFSDTNNVNDIFITDEACPTDSDNDGTDNCSDGCPLDEDKTLAGICGCGESDTDSDSDGTYDCEDACPSDDAKIAVGQCGCGRLDTDTNNSGQADCKDPRTRSVPKTAKVRSRAAGQITVTIPSEFKGVVYRVSVRGTKTSTRKTKDSTSRTITIRGLRRDTYLVSYTVKLRSIRTKSSKAVKISVK